MLAAHLEPQTTPEESVTIRRLGAGLIALLSATIAPLPAQAPVQAWTIAEYNVDDATLRISRDGDRIELFVFQGPYAIAVYLDPRSVRAWADSAERFLATPLERSEQPVEYLSRILRHADTSYRSGVVLVRRTERGKTRCFVTAWVGDYRNALIPMRDSQVRGFIAALRRAAEYDSRAFASGDPDR